MLHGALLRKPPPTVDQNERSGLWL